jgi:HSP20 family protein
VRREDETEDKFRLSERRYGPFTRRFRLPPTVAADRINATCSLGVLTITLPRAEEARPRKVQVTDGMQN